MERRDIKMIGCSQKVSSNELLGFD
jgi:hypothetical protein